MNNNIPQNKIDKLFSKERFTKTPAITINSISFPKNNHGKRNNGGDYPNIMQNHAFKNIASNRNSNNQLQINTLQSMQNKKRTSIIDQENNFYSEFLQKLKSEGEEQMNSSFSVSPELNPKKHATQQILQLKNMTPLNIPLSNNNSNTNNYLTLTENTQTLKSSRKAKNYSGSPIQQQREVNTKSDSNNILKIHNNRSRHRASVSYFVTPQNNNKIFSLNNNNVANNNNTNILSICNDNNEKKKLNRQKTITPNKGYEVESNLNEVQFLGPSIPIRKFISKWEPIEKFEILNVETFSNYGTFKMITKVVTDPNMNNIINNIIITSGTNKGKSNEDKGKVNDISNNKTERKKSEISECHNRSHNKSHNRSHNRSPNRSNNRSIDNKGEKIMNKNSIKKYASINEDSHLKKNVHSPKKKKKGFLCCS